MKNVNVKRFGNNNNLETNILLKKIFYGMNGLRDIQLQSIIHTKNKKFKKPRIILKIILPKALF